MTNGKMRNSGRKMMGGNEKCRFSRVRFFVETSCRKKIRLGGKVLYLPNVLCGVYNFRERCWHMRRLISVYLIVGNIYSVINIF